MRPSAALDERRQLASWITTDRAFALFYNVWANTSSVLAGGESDDMIAARSVHIMQELHEHLNDDEVPTYVVTSDMAQLVIHATETLDETPTLQPWELPSGAGVMFIEVPFQDVDGTWMTTHMVTWTDRLPVGNREDNGLTSAPGLTLSVWIRSESLEPETARRYGSHALPIDISGWQFGVSATNLAGTTGIPGDDEESTHIVYAPSDEPLSARKLEDDEVVRSGLTHVFWVRRMMYSVWHLCNERIEREEVDRKARRRHERTTRRPAPKVSVVDIRRRTNPHKAGTQEHREWTHRWIVRGHWRRQWYRSTEEHRPIWIEPYVKGPEDMPFGESHPSVKVVKP